LKNYRDIFGGSATVTLISNTLQYAGGSMILGVALATGWRG
jgi:hypothetical protein